MVSGTYTVSPSSTEGRKLELHFLNLEAQEGPLAVPERSAAPLWHWHFAPSCYLPCSATQAGSAVSQSGAAPCSSGSTKCPSGKLPSASLCENAIHISIWDFEAFMLPRCQHCNEERRNVEKQLPLSKSTAMVQRRTHSH